MSNSSSISRFPIDLGKAVKSAEFFPTFSFLSLTAKHRFSGTDWSSLKLTSSSLKLVRLLIVVGSPMILL